MIGADLCTKYGLTGAQAQPVLGSLDEWIPLTLSEIRDRMRRRGFSPMRDGQEMDAETLVLAIRHGDLMRIEPEPEPIHEIPARSGPAAKPRTCPRGHAWTAYDDYRWQTATQPIVTSTPLCPYCVIEFVEKAFPASGAS